MRAQSIFKQKGVTLIELLVALVICGVVIGAIYRLFIVQTRAYTVQDQVVEVQQNVRSAMELLRMTGYDDDSAASEAIPIRVLTPIVTPVQNSSITVSYEYTYTDTLSVNHYEMHTVAYWRDAATSTLFRQRTVDAVAEAREVILQNVDALTFTYGIDTDEDGSIDLNGDGIIDDNDWVAAANVGTSKVIAVRVTLTGRPTSINPDVQRRVSPRTLTSAVTLRNLIMK